MDTYGINCLKGFLYQFKVFSLHVITKLKFDKVVFEGRDDVEYTEDDDKLFGHSIGSSYLIQVKNGALDNTIIQRILLNWLKNTDSANLKYILVHSQNIVFDDKQSIIDKTIDKLKTENKSRLRADNLYKIVYNRYLVNGVFDESSLRMNLDPIVVSLIANHKHITSEQIDDLIFDEYASTYCTGMVSHVAKIKRLQRVLDLLQQRVVSCVDDNKSCVIEFKDFMHINGIATIEVTDDSYEPDYIQFKKNKQVLEVKDTMFDSNSREVLQLRGIGLSDKDILNNLICELFYRDIRDIYVQYDKSDQIEYIEVAAHDNFEDWEELYKDDRKQIYYTMKQSTPLGYRDIKLNKFSNQGCYIHLSSGNTTDELKISWSKEND